MLRFLWCEAAGKEKKRDVLRNEEFDNRLSGRAIPRFGSREDQVEGLSVNRCDTYGIDLAVRKAPFSAISLVLPDSACSPADCLADLELANKAYSLYVRQASGCW